MKNNTTHPAYDIDELVAAYPDQEFLKESQARAWAGLQQMRKKEARVVKMRKIGSVAAALIALCICSFLLLQQRPGKPAGKLNAGSRYAPPRQDKAGAPVTVPVTSAAIKKNSTTVAAHLPVRDSVHTNGHVPDSISPVQLPPRLRDASLILVNFVATDSASTKVPAGRKQKNIPPSANELFDGMQKLANTKIKTAPPADTQKLPGKENIPMSTDTLFPTSFN